MRRAQWFGMKLLLSIATACLVACASNPETKPTMPPAPQEVAKSDAASEASAAQSARTPIVIRGTGQLIGTPSEESTPPANAETGYQLTFIDTEIASVVTSVIGDGLELPYLVDPQVKGTMTLQSARPLSRDARRFGFAVRVVPLKYVNVADMEKTLRPFAPDGAILRVDEGRNLLVLAGTSRELTTLQDVISTFDVNWLAGMSFALYPVEYVDAKTLADELGAIFSEARSPIANVVRLVPLSRLNSLMVVTHEPSYLSEVEAWIKRLDLGSATPGRRIYVYDVQNGKADDLGTSLSKILSIAVETSSSAGTRETGEPPLVGSGVNGGSGDSGSIKIVPNAENNALLIYATPSEFAVIESAVKRLDVSPIQVLIEASLAEVSLTNDLRFGIQWSALSNEGPIILSEADSGSISPSFPGFSFLYTGGSDIRAVLNALESITDVNVISSPKLLVLNNREAELQIGDQVPVTVQQSMSTEGGNAPIVNSIQLRDTGVILRITPRANKSGLVLLDITQEVSDVVPTTTSNIDSPTIQQRRIASTVAVRNGETIALGGLIRDSTSRTKGGVPLLQRVPLVGNFFGSTSKNNRRTELIVLITPRVLRSKAESDELMDELREQFRGLRRQLPQWIGSTPGATSTPPAPAP